MADPFILRCRLDRPFVEVNKNDEVHALVTIEPNAAALNTQGSAHLPIHLILLVDVSGSMNILVRHDPTATRVGERLAEGVAASEVVSSVPSRREMACAVVHKLVGRLNPDDWVTLVAFDDAAHVLAKELTPADIDLLNTAVRRLNQVGGGGTKLGEGLTVIRNILASSRDKPRVRKLVLLTDGETVDSPASLRISQEIAREHNLPTVAFGMGECKVAFLTSLAKTTLAGGFNHIRHEQEAEQLFFQTLESQMNVQATNVQLKLWLSPEIHVGELYRTRPEILFVGDLQPDAQQQVVLRLEQMERGKAYEFLFKCSLPARPAPQRFRIAKASLTFDLPEMSPSRQTVDANIVVEYTADAARAQERSGDVRRVLTRAEVQRQVLFLQHKIDALHQGQASERDRTIIAKLLLALIAKFRDFGDHAMVNQYTAMRDEFTRSGTISQEMLNRSLAASSRAEELIVAQDIDF